MATPRKEHLSFWRSVTLNDYIILFLICKDIWYVTNVTNFQYGENSGYLLINGKRALTETNDLSDAVFRFDSAVEK